MTIFATLLKVAFMLFPAMFKISFSNVCKTKPKLCWFIIGMCGNNIFVSLNCSINGTTCFMGECFVVVRRKCIRREICNVAKCSNCFFSLSNRKIAASKVEHCLYVVWITLYYFFIAGYGLSKLFIFLIFHSRF